MKLLPRTLLLTAIATVIALPAQSQERGRRERLEIGRRNQAEQLLRLRERLELSEGQVAQLRELQEQATTEGRMSRERLQEVMRSMRSQSEETRVAQREVARQAREEFRARIETFRSEAEEQAQGRRASMEEILTETQREQLQQLREEGVRQTRGRAQFGQRRGGNVRGRNVRRGAARGGNARSFNGRGLNRSQGRADAPRALRFQERREGLRRGSAESFRQRRGTRVRRFRRRFII